MQDMTPKQTCPQPNGLERNLHSKTRWFTGFCNSHQVSHFTTFFIDTRAKISIAKSHSRPWNNTKHIKKMATHFNNKYPRHKLCHLLFFYSPSYFARNETKAAKETDLNNANDNNTNTWFMMGMNFALVQQRTVQ